jgi:hypothetical protein
LKLTDGNTAGGGSHEEVQKLLHSLYNPTEEATELVKDLTPVWPEGPVMCPHLSLATYIIEGVTI